MHQYSSTSTSFRARDWWAGRGRRYRGQHARARACVHVCAQVLRVYPWPHPWRGSAHVENFTVVFEKNTYDSTKL